MVVSLFWHLAIKKFTSSSSESKQKPKIVLSFVKKHLPLSSIAQFFVLVLSFLDGLGLGGFILKVDFMRGESDLRRY